MVPDGRTRFITSTLVVGANQRLATKIFMLCEIDTYHHMEYLVPDIHIP